MKPLNVIWFSNAQGAVGIVRAETGEGVQSFISAVIGHNEIHDIEFIMDWGAKFPANAADALFGPVSSINH
jgi:hypothetical protein